MDITAYVAHSTCPGFKVSMGALGGSDMHTISVPLIIVQRPMQSLANLKNLIDLDHFVQVSIAILKTSLGMKGSISWRSKCTVPLGAETVRLEQPLGNPPIASIMTGTWGVTGPQKG